MQGVTGNSGLRLRPAADCKDQRRPVPLRTSLMSIRRLRAVAVVVIRDNLEKNGL